MRHVRDSNCYDLKNFGQARCLAMILYGFRSSFTFAVCSAADDVGVGIQILYLVHYGCFSEAHTPKLLDGKTGKIFGVSYCILIYEIQVSQYC